MSRLHVLLRIYWDLLGNKLPSLKIPGPLSGTMERWIHVVKLTKGAWGMSWRQEA